MKRHRRPIPLAGERRSVVVGEPPAVTEFPEGEPTPVMFRQRVLNADGSLAFIRYTGPALGGYEPIVQPGDTITVHIEVGR